MRFLAVLCSQSVNPSCLLPTSTGLHCDQASIFSWIVRVIDSFLRSRKPVIPTTPLIPALSEAADGVILPEKGTSRSASTHSHRLHDATAAGAGIIIILTAIALVQGIDADGG